MICTKTMLNEPKHWTAPNDSPLVKVQEIHRYASTTRKARQVAKRAIQPLQAPSLTDSALLSKIPRIPEDEPLPKQKMTSSKESQLITRCPVRREFQQVQEHHPILASTGCTKDFCQAGRAVHSDEPRIGENRSLGAVEREAEGFLRELHQENFFNSDEALNQRLNEVLGEIRSSACEGVTRDGGQHGRIGGSWNQTQEELQFGIRRAWRNARKCIMRSHSDELKLCDLRNITSSAEMARTLVQNTLEAFNGGNILPTVFVYPPRKTNSRGPMIWNHQILEFAGYELEDGSILGDPMSAALTKAIIDFGWEPPSSKSRWDLLPLVVMADGDVPVMIELPLELRRLVEIRHPQYNQAFTKLDLKWVAFPALTRLGFDLGGVQYTAAPFIGWFMDAEIGVRDLPDTFRYNVLPDVVKVLGLLKTEDGIESLDDLQEYERLAALNRAQNELTYAVYWSYQQARVSMSDTLTASTKYCRYDDEFKEKHGYRLPADPYWLAPPQGSIIPVWHRGGAPNYQPKPLISKHVQDPLKAWERERQDWLIAAKPLPVIANLLPKRPKFQARSMSNNTMLVLDKKHMQDAVQFSGEHQTPPKTMNQLQIVKPSNEPEVITSTLKVTSFTVSIYFCSAGTLAEKIAIKLHDRLRNLADSVSHLSVCAKIRTLDHLQVSAMRPDKIVLIVVSSTGQGEVPNNGSQFIKECNENSGTWLANTYTRFRYAVFGNGDSRYAATYNGAATTVERSLRRLGGLGLADGLYHNDTAVQATALQALSPWWAKLQPIIYELVTDSPKLRRVNSDYAHGNGPMVDLVDGQAQAEQLLVSHAKQLRGDFFRANVMELTPPIRLDHQGTYLVTLDIRDGSYEDMGCIQVLPVNAPYKVRRALRALGVSGSARASLEVSETEDTTYLTVLTECIDLELPFQNLDWLKHPDLVGATKVNEERLTLSSSLEILEHLHTLGVLPANNAITKSILVALPLLHPRTYSIASSTSFASSPPTALSQREPPKSSNSHLDILVKPLPKGRFSQTFLTSPLPTAFRYRLLPSAASSLLTLPCSTPLIIFATGAGFAPVRCLLQRRIAASRKASEDVQNSISLFLGLKSADIPFFSGILNQAATAGVLESMSIVGSNEEKVRVYDRFLEEATRDRISEKLTEKGGWVFLCTNSEAAKGTRGAFEEVFGEGSVERMGERWVEEVF